MGRLRHCRLHNADNILRPIEAGQIDASLGRAVPSAAEIITLACGTPKKALCIFGVFKCILRLQSFDPRPYPVFSFSSQDNLLVVCHFQIPNV